MNYPPTQLVPLLCISLLAANTYAYRQNLAAVHDLMVTDQPATSDTSDAGDTHMLFDKSMPSPKWASVDANAFSHKYLTGFHMTKMVVDPDMSASKKWTEPSSGNLWGMLNVDGKDYYSGPATPVTRPEIVPKDPETGAPAAYLAYVIFGVLDGKAALRYGGFLYFASKAKLDEGWPMAEMNILSRSEAGTMRFKRGYSTFWQLGDPMKSVGSYLNFPPDISKKLTARYQSYKKNEAGHTFSLTVDRADAWGWFGEFYDAANNGPAGDEILFDFKTLECTHADKNRVMPLRSAPHEEGPFPAILGAPGSAEGRWAPITVPEFIAVRAAYYTWVNPGELGAGGFIYQIDKSDGRPMYLYFEMLTNLCAEHDDPTTYDAWIGNYMSGGLYPPMQAAVKGLNANNPKTLIFVIDMQNDFVGMSFQQPCQRKRSELTANLKTFLEKEFADGASIIASLDWHPLGHCGLDGTCLNRYGPFMEYDDLGEEYKGLEGNESYYASKGSAGRYLNRFPPHCEWHVSNARSKPTEGAKFFYPIGRILHDLSAQEGGSERVHTVFKGINKDFDSYSAMPTYIPGTELEAEPFTGGFAVSGGPDWPAGASGGAAYKPWPTECYDSDSDVTHPWCYPTTEQMQTPSPENNMWSTEHIVKSGDFDRVIVTGLVWDFCVKETAFNVKKLVGPDKQVVVPVEITRPSCEGGSLPDFIYPPAGLGTAEIMARTEKEYEARDIKLVSVDDLA